ncbi:hypothetical protein E5D57_011461 [Metarhizium anisopliae]|nr:hypothetical protein E5D57_011461 [Metarhizium anisopliae]
MSIDAIPHDVGALFRLPTPESSCARIILPLRKASTQNNIKQGMPVLTGTEQKASDQTVSDKTDMPGLSTMDVAHSRLIGGRQWLPKKIYLSLWYLKSTTLRSRLLIVNKALAESMNYRLWHVRVAAEFMCIML